SVEELLAGNDCLDQGTESIASGAHSRLHLLNDRVIGQLQRPAEGIGQQFAADVFKEVLLTLRLDVGLDASEPGALNVAGEGGRRVDGTASQVLRPGLAHRSVPFHRQSKYVKARMASGAQRIRAMPRQNVAQ